MTDIVVRNAGTVLVNVAGLTIAPRRSATLPLADWKRWLALGTGNKMTAYTRLEIVRDVEAEVDSGEAEVDSGEAEVEVDVDSGVDRIEVIKGAIRELMAREPRGESEWTKVGLPVVGAIAEIVAMEITAGERDIAWNEIQQADGDSNGD